MTLDELAQVGLNAQHPDDHAMGVAARHWYELGKKVATDHIIAAILRDGSMVKHMPLRPPAPKA